jgi:hypothetical protein
MIKPLEHALSVLPPEQWEVRQVIVLDWYDGPRSGVCAVTRPQCCFRFEVLAERYVDDDLDDRLFSLSDVPLDTVERMIAILAALGPPTQPVWVPNWQFRSEVLRLEAEQSLNTLLTNAVKTNLIIQSQDMIHFQAYWTSVQTAQSVTP